MDEQKLVPKLRFPGFTDPWEQRKLGEMGSTYSGMSGKTKEDFGHGEAVYIPYLNIFQNTLSNLSMTDKVEIDDTQNKVEYGDILFTTSSETPEEVGLSSVWLGNQENLYLNSFCFGYRLKEIIDLYFLGYALRSPYMRNQMKILAQGISRYNISKNKVMDLQINIPCIKEQKYIGEIFLRIDSLITLHQRKLEHLKLKKKSLLQKLFPREGELYPELRFPGFTDPWEQRKLGEIYKRVNERNDGTLGRDKWISVAKMYFQDPEKVQSNNLDTRTYVMKKGDIAFEGHPNNEFKFGRFVLNDIGTGIISELFPIYRPIVKYDLEFWKYAIQLERIMAPIFSKSITSSGNSSNKLDQNHFLNQMISIPTIDEQKKIGLILKTITNLITLHQRKLEHLQLLKKALLQQLFV